MPSIRASDVGLNLDHWCFACGRANPIGLHLDFEFSPGRAEARFTPRPEHQGYDAVVHGGILGTLLDEAMGWAALHQGVWGVTTRLAMTFRRPVAVGEEVRVIGEIARDRGRALELAGELERAADGERLATAEATYVKMSEERKRELIEKYGDPSAALERLAVAMRESAT